MKVEISANPVLGSEKDDRSCFEQLTSVDKKKVFTYIKRYIREITLAEDILQDALLKVYQSVRAGKYSDNGKFISWVMRIAHNLVIDHFRQTKQMNTISTDNYESDFFNLNRFSGDNIEDDLIKREMHQDIRMMITLLPDDQKEVVILKHYTGLSFKEIAEITNVSINTALGRMRYALINLRKMMEEKNISRSLI
ncbi:MAG TPA: sigma-70 family RNA polymerase sigma factor [Bacteroidales bacterium]